MPGLRSQYWQELSTEELATAEAMAAQVHENFGKPPPTTPQAIPASH
mgnify:CR=1 FL=1